MTPMPAPRTSGSAVWPLVPGGLYLRWCLLTLAAYAVLRVVFVGWNWERFGGLTALELARVFAHGLRFDAWTVAALSVVPALAMLLHRPRSRGGVRAYLILFAALQLPFLWMNFIDVDYVNFTGHRLVKESWIVVREAQGKTLTFAGAYLGLAAGGVALGLAWLGGLVWVTRRVLQRAVAPPAGVVPRVASALLLVLVAFAAIRGGWQSKPLNWAHAELFDEPFRNLAVTNSTFTLLRSLPKKGLPRHRHFADPAELLPLLNGAATADRSALPDLSGFNVVVLIVESLATQYTALGGLGESWTPFLDSIARESIAFPNHFANGRRSITGVTAILAGIPGWMDEAFVSSQFSTAAFPALGTTLKRLGYSTAFFHGGDNGTMYFDALAVKTGFDRYYGANEYPRRADHDGVWGIWDEPFLDWTLERLDELPAPFAASIFTLSSHHPFKVPPQYAGRFRKGPLPILEPFGYTDHALAQFFRQARERPWFGRTLFVIVGDHTFKLLAPGPDPETEDFRVPLLFYAPGHLPPRQAAKAVQHIDIAPSIFDLLRVELPAVNPLGASVFAPGPETVINENGRQFWARYGTQRANWSAAKGFTGDEPAIRRLQAHLQYFTDGLWNGRLYTPRAELAPP